MSALLKGLYVITDEKLTPDETVHTYVEEAIKAGASIVQYRNKTKSDEEVEDVCRKLQALCTQHKVPFIIDDRPSLANKIEADGLHIGKDDMSIQEARKIFPKGIIGVSCYGSIKKAKEAQAEGASYVAFGSFFASPTKPHSGIISMNVLLKAKEALEIPVCAIGGINQNNISEVASHEPDMISVVSAVFQGDIQANVSNLIKGMKI
ncbi:MAG TPA: thiamine phosphate synthase [Sulfurovum sp.]|jgi:thiamine-phosphate pyrophosphorylase|nr:MAG: thiamine-phosphate diphosphorylase [Sulfurovum sp. 35-42-20]OYY57243.1 MAG: thiamine-phosphate diphosphorylase [Sulfurovum sp. 28-43-6]OYZ24738.1 MAG: thiamine-phosphate diphosphorylase [Sulfurovum sp. 16-42-52]OYZ49266.1 MAG: thiamine-phosphate diphosphorylase [Sulfurovum sp. 24-42-9]OZA44736.1 MAG: thiamine-phosphate diphosphorylase [Sulfurovum sp. 17-42-90]OZA59289.1 MAG: thiamine-phosphate diphosphorylase [Sulfurovum sp. 39-42-12]HQR74124.1 thiamine phosphate synthase [Sulfurovum 